MSHFFLLLFGLIITHSANAATVAIVGDSTNTGIFTDSRLELNIDSLSSVLEDPSGLEDKQNVKRLFHSKRQKVQSEFWIVNEIWQRFTSVFLEKISGSWFQSLDLNEKQILVAAGNGDKITSVINQFSAINEAVNGVMPDETFIFFSGLDLCAISPEYITSPEDYEASLKVLSRYVRLNFSQLEGKTMYVLAPLNILQLVSSSAVLNSKRTLNDETKSCAYLQKENFTLTSKKQNLVSSFLVNSITSLSAICPTVFALHKDSNQELRLMLSGYLTAYRKALKKWATESELIDGGLNIVYLESTKDIQFGGDDIASDCFHLSKTGQEKIGQSIQQELKKASI